MTSVDFTQFVELSLYDKSPTDLVAAAQTTLQSRIPGWVPSATNVEVMLLEAMALEVSEAIFTINRIPTNMLRALIALYGVEVNAGTPPTVTLTFNAYDTDGYVIPAGTEVAILASSGEYISFFTNTEATIVASTTSVNVAATATVNTNIVNGLAIGTVGVLVAPVIGIETVVTQTLIGGGTVAEDLASWTERGAQRLARLSDTLVIPTHFTQAALENTNVNRANTIDNFNSALGTGAPGDHPGYVTVVVYGVGATLTAPQKTALQADLATRANANLIITVIDPTITTVDVTATVKVLPEYDTATVLQAVEDALAAYINPSTWPWTGTVRRNELIALMDGVAGVDYVGTITTPAVDVTIGTGSTLATAGTLTITAV